MAGLLRRLLLPLAALSAATAFASATATASADEPAAVVTFADLAEFKSLVIDSDEVWMVQLYDSESESGPLSPVYAEVASVLRGIVRVGAVDVGSGSAGVRLQQAKIAKAMQLSEDKMPAVLTFGPAKPSGSLHSGSPTDPQALLQSAVDATGQTVQKRAQELWNPEAAASSSSSSSSSSGGKSSESSSPSESAPVPGRIVDVTGSSFDAAVLQNPDVVMVAFVAPWCGHCKALLPDFKETARLLEGEGVTLAVVDATEEAELAQRYGVTGYPTLRMFPGGRGKQPADVVDYQGGRTTEDLVRACLEEVDRTGVPREVPELVGGDKAFRSYCGGTNKICLLVALPHILDTGAARRNQYRDVLAAVSKKFRGAAFQMVWYEGGSQPSLEAALDVGGSGYPAVAALSLDKGAYAVMRASYTDQHISMFLTHISTGRQTTDPLRSQPQVLDVEAWDGKDGVPIEEEPLDDIMGWGEDEDDEEDS